MALRRIGVLLSVLALLVAACAPNKTPEPSAAAATSPGPSASKGVIAEATPPPPSEPAPSQAPESPPTSVDLIEADVASGELDRATGFAYRFYAQYADPRLPEEYQDGESEPDEDLVDAVELAFDTMSTDDQAKLRPFLVRPTDPDSYFHDPVAFGTGTTAALAGRMAPVAGPIGGRVPAATYDDRCRPGGFLRKDVPQYPVTVWSVCTDSGGNVAVDARVEERANKIVAFMTDLYPRMKGLMGDPIGDAFANAGGAGEVDEAGDGRIDIYAIETVGEAYHHSRTIAVKHFGQTYSYAPKSGGPSSTSSGYIVVNWKTSGPSDDRKKGNVAHEFFHVLQNAHNQAGKAACEYPSLATGCTKNTHWFTEASAAWAEHYFVDQGDAREPDYERFDLFLTTRKSLSDNTDTNAYRSWTWPLFMQQETGSAQIIRTAWDKLEAKAGWREFQAAVNDVFPFDKHFHDFAVRVWNHELDWVPPPQKRFHDLPDPNFRDTRPEDEDGLRLMLHALELPEDDPAPRFGGVIHLPTTPYTASVTESGIPELWAEYYDVSPASEVRSITFVFSGLTPQPQLDVDMLLRIDDKWERRSYGGGTIQFCLDKARDAVQQFILVLSNHEMRPEHPISGRWTVSASGSGCLTAGNTLTFSSRYVVGAPGADYYTETVESATLHVRLKSGYGGNDSFFPFVNDGSTYQASYQEHGELKGVPGCDYIGDASGGASGTVAEEDGVVAAIHLEDDGTWLMSMAFGIEVPYTGSGSSCAGSQAYDGVAPVQFPVCEGTEIVGSKPRTFDFFCSHTGDWTWTLQGKITVAQ